jgi:hypothetical protein
MATSESDTSAIDEKREEQSSKNPQTNIIMFIYSLVISIILIIVYFGCSGIFLYACKIAQSNILPTLKGCFPYTKTMPAFQQADKTLNIFTTFDDPQRSAKIEFPYSGTNAKNSFIKWLQTHKNEPNLSFLGGYFISIIESLLNTNYSVINSVLNSLNENIPEILIVFLGPIIGLTLASLLFVFDYFYTIYLFFANMSWFFKSNANENESGVPKWEDVTVISPFDYAKSVGLVILFSIIFMFGGGAALAMLPIALLPLCLFTCVSYKGLMNGKNVTLLNVVAELFKHYKTTLVTIFSLIAIIMSFSALGTIPGIVSILTIALIYWGVIGIGVFTPENTNDYSRVVSFAQVKKTCPKNIEIKQMVGGSISKQLKNIGKLLSKG